MAIIIPFPKRGNFARPTVAPKPAPAAIAPAAPKPKEIKQPGRARWKQIPIFVLKAFWAALWAIAVLLWPVGRFFIGFDLAFQAVRTLAYWNNPNVHAGKTLLLHLVIFSVWTYVVMQYRPAGFKNAAPAFKAKSA